MAVRVNNSPGAMRQRRFRPFQAPTTVPAGTFDPGLDAQLGQEQRGYGDLQQDTAKQQGRSLSDLLLAQGRLGYARGQALDTLNIGHQRNLSDIMRQYSRLATSQGEAANAAGIAGTSGFDQQAQAARAGNQAYVTDRVNQDYQRQADQFSSGHDQYDQQLANAGLSYQRGNEDLSTQLDRAGRENTAYTQDIGASKLYQAENYAGYIPPTPPPTERTRAGLTYQQVPGGGAVLQSGRQISQHGLLGILARRKAGLR